MGELHGWQADPYGMHEQRYFSQGQPTKLVRNRGLESYDPPPQNGQGPRQPHVDVDTRVEARTNGASPGPAQPHVTLGQTGPGGQAGPPGWWLASDGNWYPPELASPAPQPSPAPEPSPVVAPPVMQEPAAPPPPPSPGPPESETTPPPGWWLASDGNWYPPELASPAPQPSPAPEPSRWLHPRSCRSLPRRRRRRPDRPRARPRPPRAGGSRPTGTGIRPSWHPAPSRRPHPSPWLHPRSCGSRRRAVADVARTARERDHTPAGLVARVRRELVSARAGDPAPSRSPHPSPWLHPRSCRSLPPRRRRRRPDRPRARPHPPGVVARLRRELVSARAGPSPAARARWLRPRSAGAAAEPPLPLPDRPRTRPHPRRAGGSPPTGTGIRPSWHPTPQPEPAPVAPAGLQAACRFRAGCRVAPDRRRTRPHPRRGGGSPPTATGIRPSWHPTPQPEPAPVAPVGQQAARRFRAALRLHRTGARSRATPPAGVVARLRRELVSARAGTRRRSRARAGRARRLRPPPLPSRRVAPDRREDAATPPPGWWLASDGNWYPPELAPR